jgi:hypothetical protein
MRIQSWQLRSSRFKYPSCQSYKKKVERPDSILMQDIIIDHWDMCFNE